MATIKSFNPATGSLLGEVELTTRPQIDEMVIRGHAAQKLWAARPLGERREIMQKLADHLTAQRREIAEIVSKEIGMPLDQSYGDVDDTGISFLQWYIDHAEEALAPQIIHEDDDVIHTVYREPRGLACSIVPWNFPFSSVIWQCGQNLLSGNAVILKHSSENPLSSQLIAKLFQDVLPQDLYQAVFVKGADADYLTAQDINIIFFTGSTKVGRGLYEAAAKKFIPVLLEMGGSAPGIVFADADIDVVLDSIYFNRFFNCGQVCDGQKRLLVESSVFNEVVEKLKALIEDKKVGDPFEEGVDMGPLSSIGQKKEVEDQVERSIAAGAFVVCGGKSLPELGDAYYAPTLLTNVTPDMAIWSEEVFGPVLPIMPFHTEEEAVRLANDTEYGLGAYVYTSDRARYERVASRLESGMVGHNNQYYLKPWNPFGGYKLSGIARHQGIYGFHDVTELKIVATEK
ncbi:MAG: aldehyde dehydrogenase family protein [Cloacibacillus evryensis]